MGRRKGKEENHFLNSSYNVWKTFVHSIHLSSLRVRTPGQKKIIKAQRGGRWGEEIGDTKL